MSVLAVVFILFYTTHTSKIENLVNDDSWSHHKSKYGLQFTPSEEHERRSIFFENVKFIEEFNAKNNGITLAVNKFAHMLPSELTMGTKMKRRMQMNLDDMPTPDLPVKKSIDWRSYGAVSEVKNQGKCGSCYAFSAVLICLIKVGAWESHLAISIGRLINLSEQEVVDCSEKEGDQGCNGGLPDYVFEYGIHTGLSLDSDYKYTGECKLKNAKRRFRLLSFVDLPAGNEQQLVRTVSFKGPVSVGIDANHRELMFYHSGILRIDDCSKEELDHAVLVVGYSIENGQSYYIIKNSWGTEWGESGYFRMPMNENMCGIASQPSYPIPKV
ncbi:Digestive cysteine proteinase 2 [Thelohanellus kitauei]|uniref:Digestive cysteine proteinase 2 n=1 Tax=Thelohanellus kitauei TaxID=669202 RepID=A0A0C2ML70_THEKT|nr:Digestive cysteine proteinase 2 [Thelohanellus kitauei]